MHYQQENIRGRQLDLHCVKLGVSQLEFLLHLVHLLLKPCEYLGDIVVHGSGYRQVLAQARLSGNMGKESVVLLKIGETK